jgi:TolB protein
VLATSAATAGVTAAAPAAARGSAASAVPWKSVGAGWVLAEHSTGTSTNLGTTTLELVSPSGAKYALYTWGKSATPPPPLVAWSPSKTEVLLQVLNKNHQTTGVFDRLNLLTGTMSTFKLASTTIVSYTRPTGLQILAEQIKPTATAWSATVERVTKAGQLVKALVTENVIGPWGLAPVYAPDGASVAFDAKTGVAVVSNAGGAVEKLPVPGVNKSLGCGPARWWNSGTILASCAGRLWLVPANGAKPRALTPARGPIDSGGNTDLGDFAAWQLPSGLYLNSAGACGSVVVNRQNANGSITTLHIPGLADPWIMTAVGPRLLIHSPGCGGGPGGFPGAAVAWYNPATKAEQVLFAKGVFSRPLAFPTMADSPSY